MPKSLFQTLNNQLDYLEESQINLVYRAFKTAEQAHRGQTRRSGEPYITHPVEVAKILASMQMDHESLMAALLHDVVEDTSVSLNELEYIFGSEVSLLVDGVTKLTKIEQKDRSKNQAESFRKTLMAMVKDIRVILVKLADRLHNMRTIHNLDTNKRRRISKETLEIFSPIAYRLGMHDVAQELDDLGFSNLHPERYRVLLEAVEKFQIQHEDALKAMKNKLEKIRK